MPLEFRPNKDGTYDAYDDNVLRAEGLTQEHFGMFDETYNKGQLSPRTERGKKMGIVQRNAMNRQRAKGAFDISKKMEDSEEYTRRFEEHRTGVGMKGSDAFPGFLKNTGLHMLNEADDLATGISRITDAMEYTLTGDPQLLQNEIQRRSDKEFKDEYWEPLEDATDLSKIGKVVPYLASGLLEVPAAKLALGGVAAAVTGPVSKGLQMSARNRGAVENVADIAGKPNLLEQAERIAVRRDARLPEVNPFAGDRGEQYVGTGLIGLGEGAILSEDRTAAGGAGENLTGTLLGRTMARPFRGQPNLRDDYEQQIVTQAKLRGKQPLPGMELGSPSQQAQEATFRSNPKMADTMHRFDFENQKIDNRAFGRVVGIDTNGGRAITGQQWMNRKTELKDNFDALQTDTSGKIDGNIVSRMQHYVDGLKEFKTPENIEAINTITPYLASFRKKLKPVPGRTGAATDNSVFSGSDYQNTRSNLDTAIKDAMANSNTAKADALRMVRSEMDGSIYNNKVQTEGVEMADAWNVAREDYALFETFSEEARDQATGNINMKKLADYFERSGDQRYTSGQSDGRLGELYDLSRYAKLKGNQQGAGFGQSQVAGFENPDIDITQRSVFSMPTPIQEWQMSWMRSGMPQRGFGPELSGGAGRTAAAVNQALGGHEGVYNAVKDTASYISGITERLTEQARELLSWGDDEEEDATLDQSGAN